MKLPAKDSDWSKRGVREDICIRKAGFHAINHDGGHHHLLDVYSKLLQSAAPPGVTGLCINTEQNKQQIFVPSMYTADDGVRGLPTLGGIERVDVLPRRPKNL